MSADEQLRAANWERMRQALASAATEYRRAADGLEAISFTRHDGRPRSPEAIISEASMTMGSGTGSILVHRLAMWAETINEIDRHDVNHLEKRSVCPYSIDDPYTKCVLDEGHSLPFDDGLAHVSGDGVMFA